MTGKKVVVTGANGMLGQDLVPYLAAKGYETVGLTSKDFNLLESSQSLREKLEQLAPDVIIHAAAYTNVDKAESEPDLAMAVNKDGTRNLAEIAQLIGAEMVYVSSDYVFDGLKNALYEPNDRPNPISTYGLSKYYGELMVTELLENYYIVRTSWLYGVHHRNFVQWVLNAAREERPITVATDWVGSPTWTGTLSAGIEELIAAQKFGTHHVADTGALSRYDQALAICKAAGLSANAIQPVEASTLNLAATRPAYSALSSPTIHAAPWEKALHLYLDQANGADVEAS